MDIFEEFINGLDFELPDKDVETIDKILASYFVSAYPQGFKMDWKKRDLCVRLCKESKKIGEQMMSDEEFLPYLKALLAGINKTQVRNQVKLLTAVILGYALRCIQGGR